jgi:chromosome segregation ATPase
MNFPATDIEYAMQEQIDRLTEQVIEAMRANGAKDARIAELEAVLGYSTKGANEDERAFRDLYTTIASLEAERDRLREERDQLWTDYTALEQECDQLIAEQEHAVISKEALPLAIQAAGYLNEIEQQREQILALEAENFHWREGWREERHLLREALRSLYDDCVEYARINHLHNSDGTPGSNHAMRQARAALDGGK